MKFGMTDRQRETAATNVVILEGLVATMQCVIAMTSHGSALNWVVAMAAWVLAATAYVVLMPNG